MNKIVTILVAAMLYLVPATYAQTSFTMSPTTINGNQGETVTVSMVVNNFTGMLSAQYGITWDPAVLQYSAVSNFNLQDLSAGSFNVNQAGDFLSFSWFDNAASGVTVDDGTTIFTMDFVVLGDASSGTMLSFADRPGLIIELVNTTGDITNSTVLTPTQFGDPNGNGGGNTGSGNTSPLVSGVSTASGDNGTTVCVDVSVGNFTDITAMDYSLVWDASVIQYAEVRNINLAGLTQSSFNTSNAANGQLGVSWANSAGVTVADGDIYQLCFNVLGNAGTSSNIAFGNAPTPINVTTTASTTDVGITQTTGLVSVNNTTPPPPPPTSTGTNLINIAALDAPAGSNVCVPVTVNGFDEIASLQFSLAWDPTIIEYTGVQNINLQDLNEGTFNATQSANGQLALAWFDNTAQGVTLADGTAIFEMCFTVLGASGTGSSIVFTDTPTPREAAQPNGTVDFTETNGAVTVDGGTVTPPVDPPPTDTTDNPTTPPTTPAGDKLVNIAAVNTPAGSTVCVPVTVNDFDLIASLQFSLSWDPNVLQFTEVKGFNLPELSAGSFNTTQASNGQAAVAWFDNTAQGVTLADGSTIFEICFTVMGTDGTSSSIVFTDTPTAREAAQPNNTVDFTETNGSVTIGDGTAPPVDPPVTPGAGDQLVNIATMNAMAGSTVCVPVTVNDFNTIASLQFSLAWDPAVLQFTEVRNFNLPELSAASFNTAQATNGQAAVAWFDNTAQGVTLTDGSTIFEMCFTVVGATGTNSTIVFTDTPTAREAAQPSNTVTFTETNGGVNVNNGTVDPPVDPPVGDGIINITPTTGAPGSTICVPVTVNDFDAIASMQFSLAWDPAVLTFNQAENFNLKDLNAGSISSDNAASGQLAVAWFDQAAQGVTLPDGTTIFELCFTVVGATGNSTTISFTDTPTARELATASNTIEFSSSDGTITVGTGTVDPPVGDGIINVASVNSPAGSSICIPVSVKDFNGIASMQFSLAWDPTVLSFTVTGSDFNLKDLNAGSFSTDNAVSGQLALAWFDQAAQGVTLDDGTVIFELCFDVIGADGASTLISFTDVPTAREIATASMTVDFEAGDGLFTVGEGEPVDTMEPPVVVLDKLVNIAPVTIQSGETFCVPVVVNDFDDIASLQFSMGWDPAVLQFTEVRNFGIADLTAAGFNTDGSASGVLAVAWFDGSAQGVTLADGATLFELCFTAVGNNGTSTTIAFTDTPTPREAATANATVPFTQTDGVISVGMGGQCAGPITAIATPTNVSCNGESDGSISLEVSGGDGQFTYQWSDPTIGNTPNPTGLAAGVYNVTITSCNGQQVKSDIPSASLTITEPPAILVVATPQNATCFGAADGRINVSLSGGTLPYTYQWSDTTLAPDNRPVNAAAGTYSLTVTDGAGCQTITDGISITSPSEIIATVATTPASCSGVGDGTATLTPSGGSGGDYTFAWGIAGVEGESPTNVPAGDYMVTITDGNQCTSVIPVTVTATIVVSGAVQVIEDACGESKGAIQITPSGGTAPYSYNWNGPVVIANTNTAENIPTGNYVVTVTDANGCFFTENIEVGGPTATLSTGVDIQNVDCPGDDSGSITLTATGGFSPYTYSWSNGATTATISNLVAGDYTVTITDSKVCTYAESFTVGTTSNMVVSVEVTKGAPDATATVTVTGGAAPYTYEWCDGQSAETATGLDEGNCSLTVIDALGCTVVQNIDIQADNPVATIDVSAPISCGGQSDGALTVTVAGGRPDYTYAWSNGGTSSTISNLGAGTYEVTVADANGNLGTQSFDFAGPASIVIDQTELNAACDDGGNVCISISGGTTPYKEIRWSNGVNDALCIDQLVPGEYGVIVTDQNDCTQEENFRITSDPACVPCYKSNMVMTPNDDGRNDAFCISCVDLAANNHLEVYNRWGQLVFEADNYQCVLGTESDCWRGNTRTGNGVVEEGGYFWILEFEDADGRRRIRDHFTILDEN